MHVLAYYSNIRVAIKIVHQEHGIRCTHLSIANENGSPWLGRMKEYCGDGGGLDGAWGAGNNLTNKYNVINVNTIND